MMSRLKNYKQNKYISILEGIAFALSAIPFFLWGINVIISENTHYTKMVYPFIGLILCIIFGNYFMLHNTNRTMNRKNMNENEIIT